MGGCARKCRRRGKDRRLETGGISKIINEEGRRLLPCYSPPPTHPSNTRRMGRTGQALSHWSIRQPIKLGAVSQSDRIKKLVISQSGGSQSIG